MSKEKHTPGKIYKVTDDGVAQTDREDLLSEGEEVEECQRGKAKPKIQVRGDEVAILRPTQTSGRSHRVYARIGQ